MGDVIHLQNMGIQETDQIRDAETESLKDLANDDRQLARRARRDIENSPKVQGKTKVGLATNLGRILNRFGRELSRDELARSALKTDNIKPSERLGRYQIVPGKAASKSKLRMLSKSPVQYLKLAETAARMTGSNCDRTVLELVDGTKFDPRSQGNEDLDLGPAERVADTIRSYVELISKKYFVSDLSRMLGRYGLEKTQIKNGVYGFKVYYGEGQRKLRQVDEICSTPLFSIVLTEGFCEWRPEGGVWVRRPIEVEERIRFGIYVGPDKQVFGAFSAKPNIFFPQSPKNRLPEISSHFMPANFEKPWVISKGIAPMRKKINDQGDLEPNDTVASLLSDAEIAAHEGKISAARLPKDHGLDLEYFRKRWEDRIRSFGRPKEKASSFKVNCAMYSSIVERVNISSVANWLDKPITSIRRRTGDAFEYYDTGSQERPPGPMTPKHDPSRGISPPDTMLAEIEVSLFYEGFQGRFDESNSDLVRYEPSWDIDDDGSMVHEHEEVDLTHDDTFLDRVEADVGAQVLGLDNWLRETRKETIARSDALLRNIDAQIRNLETDSEIETDH